MFRIKRRFKRCKVWPPRFKESSLRAHQIWVLPWKRAISATVDWSSTRMVADRHRLAAYHNNQCWRAFRGYQHRWPSTTLNPQNRGFKWFFFLFLAATHTYSKFSLKYTGDRPRQPAYEIKLMLWSVSWALAQISCITTHSRHTSARFKPSDLSTVASLKAHYL